MFQGNANDLERGFGKGARMIERLSSSRWKKRTRNQAGHRNDSHNLPDIPNQWQPNASLWFSVISIIIYWLKFFEHKLWASGNYKEFLCPLLQLYHRSYWYCASFLILQIPSRNDLLQVFSVPVNVTVHARVQLTSATLHPITLSRLHRPSKGDIWGGGCLQAVDNQSLYHLVLCSLSCHFYRTHLFFKDQYSI